MTAPDPSPAERGIGVRGRAAAIVAVLLVSACATSHSGAGPSPVTAPPTSVDTQPATTGAPQSLTLAQQGSTTTPIPVTTTMPATTVVPTVPPADMLNPAVTPATIATTICVSGYTRTIRPPVSFTDSLKVHQIATYGYADRLVSDYEEDHVIALEIGGAPAAAVNLFPESHTVSARDDTLENSLHSQVCRGALSLAEAQLRLFTAKLAHGYSRADSAA